MRSPEMERIAENREGGTLNLETEEEDSSKEKFVFIVIIIILFFGDHES